MRQAHLLSRYALALCAFFTLNVHAAPSSAAAEQKEAQAWLKKIQSAAQNLDYAGTFVYQQANQVRTSRIAHILEGKSEVEKLEVLDGKPREYIRRNDEITYYAPEQKTLLVEKRVIKDIFPSILTTNPGSLSNYYTLKMGQSQRIAGFDTKAIVLRPKDRFRYGYRLWAERSTGLLLRVQTTDASDRLLEQIAFTQLSIGDIPKSRIAPSIADTRGWIRENPVMTRISKSRWKVNAIPPGFRKVKEMKRLLTSASGSQANEGRTASAAGMPRREVTQMVFSDGLATVSVFVETAGPGRVEGAMHQGAMNILSKRQGHFWLTIVGEVPLATVQKIADSIEFKSDK